MLTVTESGFDQIPLERRAKAFTANEKGWATQMRLIEAYLASRRSVVPRRFSRHCGVRSIGGRDSLTARLPAL